MVPDSVTDIGDYAFDGCTALTVVIPDASLRTVGATNGGYTVCCYAFSVADLYLDGQGCTMIYIDETTFAELGGALALEEDGVMMAPGDQRTLDLAITPAFLRGVPVTWTSSDPTVVSVDGNGNIEALANGTATVTATIGEVSAEVEIRVITRLTELRFEQDEYWVEAKQSITPVLIREPADASEALSWSFSDAIYVTLRADGSIYAKAPSDIIVTVESELGLTASFELHVTYPLKSIRLDAEAMELLIGSSRDLGATAIDQNGTEYAGRMMTFETSDENVATVDVEGRVTARAAGTATITAATAGGVTASCEITVREPFTLNLPAGLAVIGEEAFMGDESLEAVIVPEGCQSIEARAFANCPNLIYVRIPASVESIADDAFEGSNQVRIDRGE